MWLSLPSPQPWENLWDIPEGSKTYLHDFYAAQQLWNVWSLLWLWELGCVKTVQSGMLPGTAAFQTLGLGLQEEDTCIVPVFTAFQDKLHWVREGIMDTCSSSVWHHDISFHSNTNSPKPTSAVIRLCEGTQEVARQVGWRPQKASRPAEGPREVLRGQLCWVQWHWWRSRAETFHTNLNISLQYFTKQWSRWHAFHSSVFGNCQKQGNANILTS